MERIIVNGTTFVMNDKTFALVAEGARMNTESERVIARADCLASMLRERVHVYSNGVDVWLASATTARELYHDRTPIYTAKP